MTERIFKVPRLAPRAPSAHKGDFGRALLIGGSRGMSGAISLAGMACLRSGAGLVTLATPDACADVVAGFHPSYMTIPLPCDAHGRLIGDALPFLHKALQPSTALALGPGLGRSEEVTKVCRELYRSVRQPLVIDADGLNALASIEDGLAQPGGPRVLTPHPGEFERLSKASASDRGNQIATAKRIASEQGLLIVLKGQETVIASADKWHVNTTGNPGMASGGSGDVLTGVITALLCQGLSDFDAACLGVYLHGLAGDIAAEDVGQVGMVATDLIAALPRAIRRHQGK